MLLSSLFDPVMGPYGAVFPHPCRISLPQWLPSSGFTRDMVFRWQDLIAAGAISKDSMN
jgi:hypothetical protein